MDEKSFKKRHKYLTVVNDLDGSRVLYVAPGRGKASLDGFWPTLTEEQREKIRSVSIDMWDPYIASIKKHVDNAGDKIVFDKFHVAAHLGKAVDMVRRRENKELLRYDDRRLVKTKWSWLRNGASLSDQQWRALRDADLKTARAWALKEAGMDLYLYRREHAARAFFDRWYSWTIRSRLNSKIQWIKYTEFDFLPGAPTPGNDQNVQRRAAPDRTVGQNAEAARGLDGFLTFHLHRALCTLYISAGRSWFKPG